MTTWELISKLPAILVSLYLDIVAANNNATTLSGILLNLLYLLWLNSKYIINIYSLYYGDIWIGLGNIDKYVLNKY